MTAMTMMFVVTFDMSRVDHPLLLSFDPCDCSHDSDLRLLRSWYPDKRIVVVFDVGDGIS